MNARTHLAEAFRWSKQTEVDLVEVLATGLGMAGPVLLAAAMGHISLGLVASVGSLVVSGAGLGSSTRTQAQALASALVPAALASIAAAYAAGHAWLTDAIVVVLASVAATIGGYSRALAVATVRFVLFLVIILAVADATPDREGLLLLLAAGALWSSVLSLLLGTLARRSRRVDASKSHTVPSTATAAQKFARWRRSLAQLSGWQYTLRLSVCLGIAGVLRSLWPDHHLYWIALTVALLTQRQVEARAVRTTQRALGTALGVLAASLFLAYKPPPWVLGACIGLLAGARPLLQARNYLAYSAIMAPLVMLLLDGSGPLHAGVLIDRLVATLIGVGLVLGANWIFSKFSKFGP